MPQVLEQPTPVENGAGNDFLPLNGTDYLEFYVGNARQAAYYYRSAFGFRLVAYRGPETGTRDCASYVLTQNKIRFVLTTPLAPEHPIAEHIRLHGDGVRDIALWVPRRSRMARDNQARRKRVYANLRRCATSTERRAFPRSPPMAIPSTRLSSGAIIAACFCRASRPSRARTWFHARWG